MSPTRKCNRSPGPRCRGFTVMEVLIATSIAMVVMAAVLSSYLFVGRNLIRNSNQQQLEVQSRNLLQMFARDVGMADRIAGAYDSTKDISSDASWQTMPTSGQAVFRMRACNESGGTYFYAVTYKYDSAADTVTRTVSSGQSCGTLPATFNAGSLILLTHAADFRFNYLDRAAKPASNQPGLKQIEVASFTLRNGDAAAGTQSVLTGASARLVLRNRHLVN